MAKSAFSEARPGMRGSDAGFMPQQPEEAGMPSPLRRVRQRSVITEARSGTRGSDAGSMLQLPEGDRRAVA